MAKLGAGQPDRRIAGAASSDGAAQGEFTAAGQASPWVPLKGRVFMGAWASVLAAPVGGQVQLQCSPDGGTTVLVCSLPTGQDNAWAVPQLQFPELPLELDLVYRLYCLTLTSGQIAWRLSQ